MDTVSGVLLLHRSAVIASAIDRAELATALCGRTFSVWGDGRRSKLIADPADHERRRLDRLRSIGREPRSYRDG